MDCRDVDLLAALDGQDPAAREHARSCATCGPRLDDLGRLIALLGRAYEAELTEHALAEPLPEEAARTPLPPAVRRKVVLLRRQRLIEAMRQRFGLGIEAARSLVERMTGAGEGLPSAAPASPRRLVESPEEKPGDTPAAEPDGDGPAGNEEDRKE